MSFQKGETLIESYPSLSYFNILIKSLRNMMIKFNPVIEDNPNIDLEFPPKMKPLVIKSENEKLLGTFFSPSGKEKKPIVFLLHGFPGNENNFDIAHAIRRSGFNVVVFHYRGSWGSSGEFSISNSLDDVSAVINHFCELEISKQFNIDSEKMILVGHSMGGFLSLLTSLKYPKIQNVISIAGFNFGLFTDYIMQNTNFLNATIDGLSQGAALLQGVSGQNIYDEMVSNKEDWNLVKRVPELKNKNILLLGGEYDEVSHLELHHYPLVVGLQNIGLSVQSRIYKTGHSFASTRIKLSSEIIDWLNNLKY